jgi:hypothetical protein
MPDRIHDQSVLDEASKFVESKRQKAPATFTDLRKLLEDKSIDAISIATPNHQHTLQTVWACQAGKDVYVEKPCSHDMFEAKQFVGAARHYDRIVQQGSQARSSTALQDGVKKMRDGVLGDVYMARGLCYKFRDTIGRAPEQSASAGVDYDLCLGPAPLRCGLLFLHWRCRSEQDVQARLSSAFGGAEAGIGASQVGDLRHSRPARRAQTCGTWPISYDKTFPN